MSLTSCPSATRTSMTVAFAGNPAWSEPTTTRIRLVSTPVRGPPTPREGVGRRSTTKPGRGCRAANRSRGGALEDRCAVAADYNFLAPLHPLHQPGQIGLGFVHVDHHDGRPPLGSRYPKSVRDGSAAQA